MALITGHSLNSCFKQTKACVPFDPGLANRYRLVLSLWKLQNHSSQPSSTIPSRLDTVKKYSMHNIYFIARQSHVQGSVDTYLSSPIPLDLLQSSLISIVQKPPRIYKQVPKPAGAHTPNAAVECNPNTVKYSTCPPPNIHFIISHACNSHSLTAPRPPPPPARPRSHCSQSASGPYYTVDPNDLHPRCLAAVPHARVSSQYH
jgi:hypothetical protein